MKPDSSGITKTTLLSFVMSLFLSVSAFTQSANILVTPANSNITIGQSFTVNVRVNMQSGSFNAAEIHLYFDTAYLRITNITRPSAGTFSSETIPLPATPYDSNVNKTGDLDYAVGFPSGSTSADFDILAITFTTPSSSPQTGTTSIILQNTLGHRTRVAFNGTPLSITLSNGTVNIQNCTQPTATIAAASSSSACNGQPVGLKLESATGTGPYTLVVNGNTYTNVTAGSTFATIPFVSYNLWASPPSLPAQLNNQDGQSIEVGVKFISSVTGLVNGIRYYVGSSAVNTLHTGKLWNAGNGTLLADATFTPNTGGWQQVTFANPILIAANTTYIASCFSSSGYYNETDNIFTTAINNGPLTILAEGGGAASNGVYRYGAGMPNTGFAATNYFVDIVFTETSKAFNLTTVTDATGCSNEGSLQTMNVTSVDCSTLPLCNGTNTSLSSNISGATYQWQVDNGSGYTNINDGGIYTGSTTDTLSLTSIPATMYDYKIRCVVNGNSFGRVYTLKFKTSWTGVSNDVWENPANWSCGALPDSNTDVIISGGNPNYPIINSNTNVRTLTLNTGANLTVNSGFTLTILK